jgi:tetratricopeptide (TPR) repeat protein
MRRVLGAATTALISCLQAAVPAQDSRPALQRELSGLWGEQRYEELLHRVEPHLADSREAAELWIMAAEAALKLEDFTRAIASFERGVKLNPALRVATVNLGFAYLKSDRIEDARAVFESFARDSNRTRAAKAHYGLGLVSTLQGRTDDARKAFQSAGALDADDARPPYRLGQLALQAGEYASAIESFLLALQHDELHHGAAFGLARAYALAGNASEASRWTERHRKILEAGDAVTNMIRKLGAAKDPAGARIAIGIKLQEAGARASAAQWFRAARQLDPANEQARQLLELATRRAAESRR